MTAEPPEEVGADHESETVASPGVDDRASGAVAVLNGVAAAVDDAVPAPAELRALTRNSYSTPFVNEETIALVIVVAVSAIASFHVWPESVEISTR